MGIPGSFNQSESISLAFFIIMENYIAKTVKGGESGFTALFSKKISETGLHFNLCRLVEGHGENAFRHNPFREDQP